jgi:hypothetical protein
MKLKCMIGLHSWHGCKCTDCSARRDREHDWKEDCERCALCSETRGGAHDWSRNCEKCGTCGKTRRDAHAWEGCTCSRCGRTRDQDHMWNGCQCGRCKIRRDHAHVWDGCKCPQCGKTRDQDHSWNVCICAKCGMTRDTEHLLAMAQYGLAPPQVECARCHRQFGVAETLDALLRGDKRALHDLIRDLGYRSRATNDRSREIEAVICACGDGVAPHLLALLSCPSVLYGDSYSKLISLLTDLRWCPSSDDDRTILYLHTNDSKAIAEMGQRSLPGLIKCLLVGLLAPSNADYHLHERMKEARKAIVSLGDAATADTCHLLSHQDPAIRKTGAQILGGIASPACVPPLLAMSLDPDATVRAMVAWALGQIHTVDGIQALVAGTFDVDPAVRLDSVAALMRIEDERCRCAVLRLLDSETNEAVLKAAVISVGRYKDARGVPALAKYLRAHWDTATKLTDAVSDALGVIGGSEAESVLLDAVGILGEGRTLFDAKTNDPSSEPHRFGPVCEALATLRCVRAIGPLARAYNSHPNTNFSECAGKAITSILSTAINDVSTPDLKVVLAVQSFKYSSGSFFSSYDDSYHGFHYECDMTEAHVMATGELSRRCPVEREERG